jgi:D-proline reductase (dithiol) PrdB
MINTEALQRSYNKTREKWDPHFEWVVNDSSPWTPLRQPLAETALALVSTCGAYRPGVDCPFDAANYYGDPSFKEIPTDTPVSTLDFSHTHYNHEHVSQDPNVAFPLDRLQTLETEGVIRSFVNPAISFTGFLPEPRQLVNDTAPVAAQRLLAAGAQAALLLPC